MAPQSDDGPGPELETSVGTKAPGVFRLEVTRASSQCTGHAAGSVTENRASPCFSSHHVLSLRETSFSHKMNLRTPTSPPDSSCSELLSPLSSKAADPAENFGRNPGGWRWTPSKRPSGPLRIHQMSFLVRTSGVSHSSKCL